MNTKRAWEDPNITVAKLCDVDDIRARARVLYSDNTGQYSTWVDIRIPKHNEDLFYETWNYGDTAFLDENKNLIDWSYLSIWNGTLVPAKQGVDVYE